MKEVNNDIKYLIIPNIDYCLANGNESTQKFKRRGDHYGLVCFTKANRRRKLCQVPKDG